MNQYHRGAWDTVDVAWRELLPVTLCAARNRCSVSACLRLNILSRQTILGALLSFASYCINRWLFYLFSSFFFSRFKLTVCWDKYRSSQTFKCKIIGCNHETNRRLPTKSDRSCLAQHGFWNVKQQVKKLKPSRFANFIYTVKRFRVI